MNVIQSPRRRYRRIREYILDTVITPCDRRFAIVVFRHHHLVPARWRRLIARASDIHLSRWGLQERRCDTQRAFARSQRRVPRPSARSNVTPASTLRSCGTATTPHIGTTLTGALNVHSPTTNAGAGHGVAVGVTDEQPTASKTTTADVAMGKNLRCLIDAER